MLAGRSHAIILTAQDVKRRPRGGHGWPADPAANIPWLLVSVNSNTTKYPT